MRSKVLIRIFLFDAPQKRSGQQGKKLTVNPADPPTFRRGNCSDLTPLRIDASTLGLINGDDGIRPGCA